MGLVGDVLGQDLKTITDKYQNQAPPESPAEMEQRQVNYWKDVGNAIVDHVTENAEVSTTVATSGTATSQTGQGTGTVS